MEKQCIHQLPVDGKICETLHEETVVLLGKLIDKFNSETLDLLKDSLMISQIERNVDYLKKNSGISKNELDSLMRTYSLFSDLLSGLSQQINRMHS